MGSNDVAPPGAPEWLVPMSNLFLGAGVLFWDATYILMTIRSIKTKSYSMPLLALAINISWEIVYPVWVTEMLFERIGFFLWLLLDVGLVYTTVKYGHNEWQQTSPFVARNIGRILALLIGIGCVGHFAFASWWLSRPGVGHGVKTGKWWRGKEGFDTTELAFWSAGVTQMVLSAGSLAMLMIRAHSGGASYWIWLTRFVGSVLGMWGTNLVLWTYWPEAHGYVVNPFGMYICGLSLVCDIIYPFQLWKVRRTEKLLVDGRIVNKELHDAALHPRSKKAL